MGAADVNTIFDTMKYEVKVALFVNVAALISLHLPSQESRYFWSALEAQQNRSCTKISDCKQSWYFWRLNKKQKFSQQQKNNNFSLQYESYNNETDTGFLLSSVAYIQLAHLEISLSVLQIRNQSNVCSHCVLLGDLRTWQTNRCNLCKRVILLCFGAMRTPSQQTGESIPKFAPLTAMIAPQRGDKTRRT